jgi:hypothetical protein
MSFDDLMMMCVMGAVIAGGYVGLYRFGLFYHARKLERAREEFKDGLHKPQFFGDGQ